MKKLLFIALLFFCFVANGQPAAHINVMSYNIRFNNPGDGVNAWPNRKDMVKGLVQFYDTDILSIQEALADQVDDLLANSNYSLEGAGRDDGKRAGEFSAILYNKNRFKKLDGGMFWLSETPQKPSKGWDAAILRICTWIKLADRQTKKEFFVFNTHYDHVGVVAREKSSILIKTKIQEIAGNNKVILTGDLNVTPDKQAVATLKTFLNDTKEVTSESAYGPEGTFNGFKFDALLKEKIDYIFVDKSIKVLKFGVLSDSKELSYPSDHLPVFARITL